MGGTGEEGVSGSGSYGWVSCDTCKTIYIRRYVRIISAELNSFNTTDYMSFKTDLPKGTNADNSNDKLLGRF